MERTEKEVLDFSKRPPRAEAQNGGLPEDIKKNWKRYEKELPGTREKTKVPRHFRKDVPRDGLEPETLPKISKRTQKDIKKYSPA